MPDKKLRSGLIRLAYSRPEYRVRLLPLLSTSKQASDVRSKLSRSVMQVRRILTHMVQDMANKVDEAGAATKSTGGTVRYTTRAMVCNAGRELADEIRTGGVAVFKGVRQNVGVLNRPDNWGLSRADQGASRDLWKTLMKHLIQVQQVTEDISLELMPTFEGMDPRARKDLAAFVENTFCDLGEKAGQQFSSLTGS